jgi:uncharacterized protein
MPNVPLFPLNTVLFPSLPIYLHIFEDRYKLMIGECVEQQRPFGVVLLKSGSEVLGNGAPAEPEAIGCMAHISHTQPVGDGRVNVVAVGRERFRILAHEYSLPYLSGNVEYLTSSQSPSLNLELAARKFKPLLSRYLNVLQELENFQFNVERLPTAPLDLFYLGAHVLRLPVEEKQQILVESHINSLVQTIMKNYQREMMFIEMLKSPARPSDSSTFSVN